MRRLLVRANCAEAWRVLFSQPQKRRPGRPRILLDMAFLTVKIERRVARALYRRASKEKCSVSALVRAAIDRALEDEQR